MDSEEQYIIKAPGKLILLGEYAVVEKGIPAVVTSILKSIYCYIRESEKILFTSQRINISKVEFEYSNQKVNLVSEVSEIDVLSFSKNAMEIALRYLEEMGYTLKKFEINILSDLSNRYGVKFGFGSSSAVTVSIIGAILYIHGVEINKNANRDIIFKLSAISHYISQGSGSGVDIASSVYGGLLVYQSYNSEWLGEKIKELKSIKELVNENWIYLKCERVNILIDFIPVIGWTGKPASTKYFLQNVRKLKKSNNEDDIAFYKNFLSMTKKIVDAFIHGIKNNKPELIDKAIVANKNLLNDLAEKVEIEMETPALNKLITIAKKLGFASKFSGAGGGDCGYAIVYNEKDQNLLKATWKKNGIEPINTYIEENGVCDISYSVRGDDN